MSPSFSARSYKSMSISFCTQLLCYVFALIILSMLVRESEVSVNADNSCAIIGFRVAQNFSAGIKPRSVVIGDFNRDGKADLAIANYGSGQGTTDGSISILSGDGVGGFSAPTNIAIGVNPRFIVSGDFNGDGKIDLAVVTYSSCCINSSVTILQGDGTGNFTVRGQPIPVGSDPASMAAGDFNGDGKLDLVAVVSGASYRNVAILLGNGAGEFSPAINYSIGSSATSIAAGDFNGDGKLDVVTANTNDFSFSLLLGNGNGSFGAPAKFILGAGANPQSIVVGDFNNDGKLDVATGATSNNISVVLGNGAGGFGSPTNFATAPAPKLAVSGDFPYYLVTGDFNGDSNLDIITSNSANNISILLGDGNGNFGTATNYAVGSGPIYVASGDFNGDGKRDLVTVNAGSNDISILLGEGTGSFKGSITYPTGLTPRSVVSADFNRDGKIDLAVANEGQNYIQIFSGSGDGGFTQAATLTGIPNPTNIAVADLNSDGNPDLAVTIGGDTYNSISILLGDGRGSFGSPTSYSVGQNPYAIAIGDFNNDGKADIAVANNASNDVTILLGTGDGTFGSKTTINVGSSGLSIAVGDFNNDGNTDLVVGRGNGLAILLGNGLGGFSSPQEDSAFAGDWSFVVGDFNHDGKRDLAISNPNRYLDNHFYASILFGNGDGTFQPLVKYVIEASPSSLTVGDFNGDGITDLVAVTSTGISILKGDGTGSFASAQNFSTGGGSISTTVNDFNGDGKADLAVVKSSNTLAILLNVCGGLSAPAPTPVSDGAMQFSAASYNVNEGTGFATITVTRTGNTTSTASVDYATSDNTAKQRTDYTTSTGTLSFAAGEIQKQFTVLVIDNTRVDGNRTINLTLSNPVGVALADPKTAVLTIQDNDTAQPTMNPIDVTPFFVRQQYADFLNRAPDDGGLAYWSNLITSCSPTDEQCINSKRVTVSAAFFIEQEFQLTGNYVYRMYTATYGQRPTYAQFMPDRARINPDASQIEASKQQFADLFVQRAEFLAKYPATMTPDAFIDGLIATVKTETNGAVDLTSQRATLLSTLQTSGRGSAVRQVAETTAFQSAEYNKAFVTMQYFGYLRRDPEDGGFNFWLDVLNNKVANNYRGMVCAFITSAEYQDRFSSVITRNDSVCGQIGQ